MLSSKRNSQERSRGTFPAENPETHDEYRDAQLIDIGIAERAYRERDTARRYNVISSAVAVLALLVAAILAGKDHTEALVYRDDGQGAMRLLGYAGTNSAPSAPAVQHALSRWLQNVRDIPAMDPTLAARNHNDALIMVARGSDADTRLHAYFTVNDAAIAAKSMQRTVTRAHVDRRTDITYDATWTEQTTVSGGATSVNTYQGTITLAAPPAAPTDPLLGESNPAGVFITTYLLEAPN